MPLTAADYTTAGSECEQLLSLLSRYEAHPCIRRVLEDAREICRLLRLYSFRSSHHPEKLLSELAARYRPEILSLYGNAVLPRRESSSCYLRLEALAPMLIRVAMRRLILEHKLPLTLTQLTLSDGILVRLLQKETADG